MASFSQVLLSQIAEDVRLASNGACAAFRSGWTYHFSGGHYEFHGPDEFYWHGNASDAWEARYKGWCAWLAHMGVEGYRDEE